MRLLLCLVVSFLSLVGNAQAQVPTLTIGDRETSRSFTLPELLASPLLRDLTVADRIYGRSMSYRVIPMAELLKDLKIGADDYLMARANDGYSINIPGRLIASADTARVEAFLAVEDPKAPWPVIPENLEKLGAGAFFIVWKVASPAHVSREHWVYQLASLKVIDSPLKRWPGLAVAPSVPFADPQRSGLDRYVALCVTCHKLNGEGGAGAASGPDLGQPKNVLETFDAPMLKKFIRDPKSVRPDSKMPKFDEAALHDDDIDAMIAWLASKR